LKKLTGTFQKSRNLTDEIDPPVLLDSSTPERLGKYGKEEWNRVIGILKSTGAITELDTSALFVLCYEWQVYNEAKDEVERDGKTITSQSGYPMINPMETIRGQSYGRWKEMLVQFGMSPSSRSKVSKTKAPEKEKEDPFVSALGGMRVAK
jgi:P27 family predicted phage terminase small subunit